MWSQRATTQSYMKKIEAFLLVLCVMLVLPSCTQSVGCQNQTSSKITFSLGLGGGGGGCGPGGFYSQGQILTCNAPGGVRYQSRVIEGPSGPRFIPIGNVPGSAMSYMRNQYLMQNPGVYHGAGNFRPPGQPVRYAGPTHLDRVFLDARNGPRAIPGPQNTRAMVPR